MPSAEVVISKREEIISCLIECGEPFQDHDRIDDHDPDAKRLPHLHDSCHLRSDHGDWNTQ